MRISTLRNALGALALMAMGSTAWAWSKPGHMVNAAIAYEELQAKDPKALQRIVQIMAQHPDKGTFEVAINGAEDQERTLRLLMEMARWSDDIRGGSYDHPTWHYTSRPLVDPSRRPPRQPADIPAGAAVEAFALNAKVAGDVRAPAPERAVALCWIFHLAGDIHQPLHTADWHSALYPEGDQGGNRQYVLDPQTRQPVSLHSYWDGAVSRSGESGPSLQRARELRKKFPRAGFAELSTRISAGDFAAWAEESNVLARSQAYGSALSTSAKREQAPALPAAYVASSTDIAERRVTLAGYRLADLLMILLRD